MRKRLLILDNSSNCLDMAIRAKISGWSVQWYDRPRPDGLPRRAGEGMFDKIKDFSEIQRKWLDWADLIYMPDNVCWTDFLEPYRLKGYPILAASPAAAALELDRNAGQLAMKKAGMRIMESKAFNEYDAAIAFVKKNPQFLVSKPSGDANKALSYVAHDPADLVYMLTRWKNNPALKSAAKSEGFILQERKYGVEMAVGGFFGPHGFGQYFYENWEYKKLMNGDLGVNTGEMGTLSRMTKRSKLADIVLKPMEEQLHKLGYVGYVDNNCIIDDKGIPWPMEFTCYDDQTEVLTKAGWKFFKDCNVGELVATLNPDTNFMEYQEAVSVISKPHNGELIHFSGSNSAPDLCVTPDHQMWVRDSHKKDFEFMSADKVEGRSMQIQRFSYWKGEDVKEFVLPSRIEKHQLGRHNKIIDIEHPEIKMPMEVWVRFLGLYISEGSLGKNGYIVNIAQNHKNHYKIMPLLEGFPIPFDINKNGSLQFNSIQLGEYIKNLGLGLCNKKFIPENIKQLTPKYLKELLKALIAGDGTTHKKNGQRTYYTSSKVLADDVQELFTKIGNVARIRKENIAGTEMSVNGGKTYIRNHDKYNVQERTEKVYGWTDKRMTKRVPYNGMVYCLNVPPHHLLYVRRNGNPSWCGNCRDGWPTKHNVTAHVKNEDTVQWMLDMVNGQDTMECIDGEVCVSVLIALPDFPYSKITNKELCGIPIRGADDIEHIHLSEAMMGIAPTMVGDKVVDMPGLVTCGDYTMVVTGTGRTITEARKDCYNAVKKVKIPNSMFYRTDIGSGRMDKQLPELHRLGYAKGLERV